MGKLLEIVQLAAKGQSTVIRSRERSGKSELSSLRPPLISPLSLLSPSNEPGTKKAPREAARDWDAEAWRMFYEERASIFEFDGGLPRQEAEDRSFESCIAEWFNRHPAPSPPGPCAQCGEDELPWRIVLPFGTDDSNRTWLHRDCWPAWCQERREVAIRALAAVGLAARTENEP
jgi:hypothetical protein